MRQDARLDDRGDDSAAQVEEEESHVPETVFDVVAEDVQKKHVADEVHEAAVQEHAREYGHETRHGIVCPVKARGHQAEGVHETVEPGATEAPLLPH